LTDSTQNTGELPPIVEKIMFYNPRSYSPTVEEEKQNKANVSEKKEKKKYSI
jgi:hypothetical protein